MLTTRLMLGIAISLLGAALSFYIGRRFLAQAGEGDNGRAVRRFGVWWIFLAVDVLVNQIAWFCGGIGFTPAPLVTALTLAQLASIGVMLWGLGSYLAYLFTGRHGVFRAATIFLSVQVLVTLAIILYLRPNGIKMGTWSGEIAYVIPPPPGVALFIAVFFLLPPVVGAIAYGTLFFRTRDKHARRRIAAVSLGITAWFLGSIILNQTGRGTDVGAAIGFALSLGTMFAVARAYSQWPARPPRSAREDKAVKERIEQLV